MPGLAAYAASFTPSTTPGPGGTDPWGFPLWDYNGSLLDPGNESWPGNDTIGSVPSAGVTAGLVFKSLAMITIMVSAVFGNVLTILAVLKVQRLRILANSFIVSLAFADLLVAIVVMPFNAANEIAGRWVFSAAMCDVFNANDVLFSTASLLHICCISMDRYIAIMDPFHYETKMTKRRAALMLAAVWVASALISHIPIHLGWYTTEKQQEILDNNPDQCTFEVNKIYAAISSSISFWIPCSIMVFTYVMIYREARRQEKQIHALTHMKGHSMEQLTSSSKHRGSSATSNGHTTPGTDRNRNGSYAAAENQRLSQDRRKMKREHKAAKTLGIIMGAFLCCWLPFFLWYVTTTMCGEACYTPPTLISVLFWVGYFNSALNPLIYAFFNRDFRNAFKRLLTSNRCTRWCGERCFCCDHRASAGLPGRSWCCCGPRGAESGPETDALKATTAATGHRASTSVTQSGQNTPSPVKRPSVFEH